MNDNSDKIWQRTELDSPCVKLCAIHPVERLCVGCLRTIEEITAWSRMPAATRREIMAELPTRAPRLHKRRGGHAGRDASLS